MARIWKAELRMIGGEAPRCKTGKVCYDKKGALTVKNARMKSDHVKLRIYVCPVCHTWHLTKLL